MPLRDTFARFFARLMIKWNSRAIIYVFPNFVKHGTLILFSVFFHGYYAIKHGK
jgi:hypothetical protein